MISRAGRRRRTLLVVGGAGRMGRRMASFFARRGFRVLVHDPAGAPKGLRGAPLAAASSADVIVVAASLERCAAALDAVVALRPTGLVFDIASVKSPLVPSIRRARKAGVAIASVHPMFGPSVRSFRGHDLIVCDAGDAGAARRARALFRGAGLVMRTMPLAEHDPWIARTMGLAHVVALASAFALAGLGVARDDVDGRTTTSFRHLLALVGPILDQDPALTRAIQAANPGSRLVLSRLAGEVASLRKLLSAGDASGLAARLAAVRRRLR